MPLALSLLFPSKTDTCHASPQDSGISQLSTGGADTRGNDVVDDKHAEDTNGILSGRSSSVSSPTHRQLSLMSDSSRNGLDTLTDDDLGRGIP